MIESRLGADDHGPGGGVEIEVGAWRRRGEGVRPSCVGWVLGNDDERMIWRWFSKFGSNGSGKTAAEERVDRPAPTVRSGCAAVCGYRPRSKRC